MGLKEGQKRRRQERAKERQAMLKRIQSGKPPKSLNELGFSLLVDKVTEPRIVTCPQGVVSYTARNVRVGSVFRQLASPEEIDAKIREILAISPDMPLAKLRKFGEDMGILIRSFEKAKPAPSATPTDEDVLF
jgi:hypothetical protein